MSKFSKKSLAILLTIAFVLTTVVLPASAKTTYSTETAPRVSDDTENAELGIISIEIDSTVIDEHEAWVELPKDFIVNRVEVAKVDHDGGDGEVTVEIDGEDVTPRTGENDGEDVTPGNGENDDEDVTPGNGENDDGEDVTPGNGVNDDEDVTPGNGENDDGEDVTPGNGVNDDEDVTPGNGENDDGEDVTPGTGENNEARPGDQGFALKIKTPIDAKVVVRLFFADVKVPKGASGAIKATFENLKGQLVDGEVIIGYASGGALNLAVRESENFADKGEVTIRVTEATAGTLKEDKALKVKLPRGFEWVPNKFEDKVIYGNGSVKGDYVVSNDGRTVTITFKDASERERTAIDITGKIIVSDPARAKKGDIVATVSGDYTTDPEELVVGVYGDFEFDVEAGDPETVYAGRVKQAIADITISEEIAGTFIHGRYVILELPDWAKWGTLPKTPKGKDVELDFVGFYGTDGRTARYEVKCDDEEQSAKPEEIKLKDMEIVLSPEAPVGEDVVVKISGSAGVRGEVVVGKVAAPAELKVDEIKVIGIGRTNQEIGTITITEAKAGMFRDNKDIVLHLERDLAWESGYDVEVVEGDIELGSVRRIGERDLAIRVEAESDVPSTIQVTGTVRTLRTIPEGETFIRLRGAAVIETTDPIRLGDQWDDDDNWYVMSEKRPPYCTC